MNLWEMIFGLVLIGIVAKLIQGHLHGNVRQREEGPHEDSAALKQEVRALRERVAVLERIATEPNHGLEQEIESLRDR